LKHLGGKRCYHINPKGSRNVIERNILEPGFKGAIQALDRRHEGEYNINQKHAINNKLKSKHCSGTVFIFKKGSFEWCIGCSVKQNYYDANIPQLLEKPVGVEQANTLSILRLNCHLFVFLFNLVVSEKLATKVG
jgi:hypothetical protein